MALMSDPIAVAAATATPFDIPPASTKVRIAVVFYNDVGATTEDVVGGGTRDIAVSVPVPVDGYGAPLMPVVGASVSANPGGSLKVLDLGIPTGRISVACAQATDPEGATHYRIFVA